MKKPLLGGCIAMLAAFTGLGVVNAAAQDGAQAPASGEGVLCSWNILAALAEVARTCHPDGDAGMLAEVDDMVSRIEAYVSANGAPYWTPDAIATFKRERAFMDAPRVEICTPDNEGLYEAFLEKGIGAVSKTVDDQLSRPGKPTWGSCI